MLVDVVPDQLVDVDGIPGPLVDVVPDPPPVDGVHGPLIDIVPRPAMPVRGRW